MSVNLDTSNCIFINLDYCNRIPDDTAVSVVFCQTVLGGLRRTSNIVKIVGLRDYGLKLHVSVRVLVLLYRCNSGFRTFRYEVEVRITRL